MYLAAITNTPATAIDFVFFASIVVAFLIGGAVGYIIALRSKRPETKVTAVQLFAAVIFFGYVWLAFVFQQEVQWIIAVAILATGYGAKGGAFLEKTLERADAALDRGSK